MTQNQASLVKVMTSLTLFFFIAGCNNPQVSECECSSSEFCCLGECLPMGSTCPPIENDGDLPDSDEQDGDIPEDGDTDGDTPIDGDRDDEQSNTYEEIDITENLAEPLESIWERDGDIKDIYEYATVIRRSNSLAFIENSTGITKITISNIHPESAIFSDYSTRSIFYVSAWSDCEPVTKYHGDCFGDHLCTGQAYIVNTQDWSSTVVNTEIEDCTDEYYNPDRQLQASSTDGRYLFLMGEDNKIIIDAVSGTWHEIPSYIWAFMTIPVIDNWLIFTQRYYGENSLVAIDLSGEEPRTVELTPKHQCDDSSSCYSTGETYILGPDRPIALLHENSGSDVYEIGSGTGQPNATLLANLDFRGLIERYFTNRSDRWLVFSNPSESGNPQMALDPDNPESPCTWAQEHWYYDGHENSLFYRENNEDDYLSLLDFESCTIEETEHNGDHPYIGIDRRFIFVDRETQNLTICDSTQSESCTLFDQPTEIDRDMESRVFAFTHNPQPIMNPLRYSLSFIDLTENTLYRLSHEFRDAYSDPVFSSDTRFIAWGEEERIAIFDRSSPSELLPINQNGYITFVSDGTTVCVHHRRYTSSSSVSCYPLPE